jgi:hypothetical protein
MTAARWEHALSALLSEFTKAGAAALSLVESVDVLY